MDSSSVVEEIKRIVHIEDLVSDYVPLERAGRRLKARCPFHEEKTPSFYVSPELGMFKCFGCGAGGDLFEFLMRIERLTFPEAGERLAERAGLAWNTQPGDEARSKRRQLARRANDLAASFYETALQSPAGAQALEYLRGRGYTDETIREFRLGFAPPGWDNLMRHLRQKGIDDGVAAEAGLAKQGQSGGVYDAFRHRVMFPIIDVAGRVLGFGGRALDPDDPAKYLNTSDTPMFKKGRNVYALNAAHMAISRSRQAIVVEGYTDVLALHQAGIDNAVACLGTALTEDHLSLLSRYADEVILAYDADTAGMNAAVRNIPMLEQCAAEVSVVLLPAGLDPDECVKERGAAGFREVLQNRKSPVEYEIDLVFSQHRDRGPAAVSQAAQKALEILLRVPDRARRDEFLGRAADRWGEGSPGKTEAMERSLRDALNQRVQARGPQRRGGEKSPRDRGYIVEGVARLAADTPRGVLRAEEELLTAALADRGFAQTLCQVINPEGFSPGPHRNIAEAIAGVFRESKPYSSAEVMRALVDDEATRERAVELAFRSSEEVQQEVFQACLEKVKNYRTGGGHLTTYEVGAAGDEQEPPPPIEDFEQLRRRVVEKLNSDTADPDDPDIKAYQDYMSRTHGPGNG